MVPYDFQKKGAAWLRARKVALLCDQMGLGKTIQALGALERNAAVVVVCPIGLLDNWYREAKLWRPEFTDMIANPKDWHWPVSGQITFCPYSRLPAAGGDFPTWMGEPAPPGTTLILDEAHYVKSSKSARSRAVRALASQCSRVWLLTGTPLLNRPPELWALLQASRYSAKRVFGSWDGMVSMFGGKKLRFGGYAWGTPSSLARARLDIVMLRRTRAEVLSELPTKTYQDLFVPVEGVSDPWDLSDWTDDEVHKECIGGRLARVRVELAFSKFDAAVEFAESCEEQEEPLVVFSSHVAPVEQLGMREGWKYISGNVSGKERDAIIQDFQAGKLKGIAGTIGAMGVGVTLTRAAHVLFIDQDWVPANNAQAEDRLCRIGQTRGVIVTRLIADHPVDRRVAMILSKKQRILDALSLGEQA